MAPLALGLSLGLCLETAAGATSLEGVWSGSGMVNPKDGARESVRCRLSYKQESEKVFGLTATCATRSRKIQQTGQLLKVGPATYVGDFYNPGYDISGRVRVVVNGSAQTVTFKSARGSGSVNLRKR
ncbi:MAG TPA: hypothetical protein VMW57_05440 [Methyloceanibacter sp.]|nr:hypothetical protein [Methyloceanibacter sp.]